MKQSDSSSCPDCGMDPQDVPHLFDCPGRRSFIYAADLCVTAQYPSFTEVEETIEDAHFIGEAKKYNIIFVVNIE